MNKKFILTLTAIFFCRFAATSACNDGKFKSCFFIGLMYDDAKGVKRD